MAIISFDVHKRYTWAAVESEDGQRLREERVNHSPGCRVRVHMLRSSWVLASKPQIGPTRAATSAPNSDPTR